MGRPIRLLVTVLLLPLRGQPDSPQWGAAQDEWNAMHILGPPTADGVFREPLSRAGRRRPHIFFFAQPVVSVVSVGRAGGAVVRW